MSKDAILFDPGFHTIISNFSDCINLIYKEIKSAKDLKQKKQKFNHYHQPIKMLINDNAAFYHGCMLWGTFCKYYFKTNPRPLEGNPFTELSPKEIQEIDFFYEIKFYESYVKQYKKDCVYYLGKMPPLDKEDEIFRIIEDYKKFLEINNQFIHTKYTSHITLPDNYAQLEKLDEKLLLLISDKIIDSIKANAIKNLLDVDVKVLKRYSTVNEITKG